MFLSTPPSRVATIFYCLIFLFFLKFLSTPPSRVATTQRRCRHSWSDNVSIHATLAGGDPPVVAPIMDSLGFYPRHPRGWRHLNIGDETVVYRVSIHATLAGGDGMTAPSATAPLCFYPRHPRGWRLPLPVHLFCTCRFYPRHPRGWRQQLGIRLVQPLVVSIHATLAGGDPQRRCRHSWSDNVSIHATLAGGDTIQGNADYSVMMFLSTPPSRVATCDVCHSYSLITCFYPRHPRGWRL